jgi:hypothetical protein
VKNDYGTEQGARALNGLEESQKKKTRLELSFLLLAWCLFHAVFFILLGLPFNPKDASDMFTETSVDFPLITRLYVPYSCIPEPCVSV